MKLSGKAKSGIRRFAGATAIVTGAASGIGKGISMELARRGCEVVLADLQSDLAQENTRKICAEGGVAQAACVDVTDSSAVQELITRTHERTGRIDYLFNNVGINFFGHLDHYRMEDWHQLMRVNLFGIINGVQAVYGIMKAQGFGHIINTASVGGLMPNPGMVAYATAKHGVVGLTNSLRAESARLGIRASVLCPGYVKTPMLDRWGKYGKSLIPLSSQQQQIIRSRLNRFKPIPPEIFASKALDQVAKNKGIIVIPRRYKWLWMMYRLFPSGYISVLMKIFQKVADKLEIH
jgi:NAD(P)-dependent dehydrogenase (short-subunit alcohol dehydrogenase family)